MAKIATMVSPDSITVNYNGQTHIIRRSASAKTYEDVKLAIKEGRHDDIPALMVPGKRIEKNSNGMMQVRNGEVFVDNVKAPDALSRKILSFMEDDLPFEPLVKFTRNLQRNPSYRSVNQLFQFLEKNDHPITDDGKFIAYKKVRRCSDGHLRDSHSGTVLNDVGLVVEMMRNQVDEDPERTCSHGLHAANWDYAQSYSGDVMVELEIDPADVVAVPVDYNNAKMRVCRYVVRGIVENPNSNGHLVNSLPANDDDNDHWSSSGEEDEPSCAELDCEGCEDCDEGCDDSCECDEPAPAPKVTPTLPTNTDIVYHAENSIRKMSSDRLSKYFGKLSELPGSEKKSKTWKATHKLVEQVLTDRGYNTDDLSEEE